MVSLDYHTATNHFSILSPTGKAMVYEKTRMGYCSTCEQNNPHAYGLPGARLRWIDWGTLTLSRFFRPGPWHCIQCDQPSRFLKGPRGNTSSVPPTKPNPTTELNGNFIRSDQSLLLQKRRAARFSQKYRDGVVKKIVSGSHPLSQVCRELNLPESDLIAWVADLLARREQKIEDLKRILAQLSPEQIETFGIQADRQASQVNEDS